MTDRIQSRLQELGLELPAPMQMPPGLVLPFSWCKVLGRRVLISGHLPLAADGSLWPVTGKVGPEIGSHVRSAVGFAELPMNVPVELEAELEID